MGSLTTGTLAIDGDITTAALLSSLANAAIDGQVTLRGVVDNSAPGSVLEIKSGTALANVNLNGGTVRGGTLRLTSGALRCNTDSAYNVLGTLDGVRVLGDLTVANGVNTFTGYTSVLGLRNGVTFASPSGTGRGSVTVSNPGAELRALDAETLDHVNLRFSATGSTPVSLLLTTASATTLTLGADASLNVLTNVDVGGGGAFSDAGAVTVQPGGKLSVLAGTTLVKSGSGSLAVASGGTLAVGWTGTTAPLAGVSGATIDGVLALTGSLTGFAYGTALGSVTGAGAVTLNGTLDNTGRSCRCWATRWPAGSPSTARSRAAPSSPQPGALTLGAASTMDGVTFRGPASLAGSSSGGFSGGIFQPIQADFFRNGLNLIGASGSGPGALTLSNLSLQAADTELLDNAGIQLNNATLSAASGSRLKLGAHLALDVTGNSSLANAASQGSITIEGNSTLNVDGGFVSGGALNLKFGGNLNLSGSTTTAGLMGLIGSAAGPGTLSLSNAVLDNSGATLTLLATSRLNNLAASNITLKGGTVINAGGSFRFTGGTMLDGVTWQGVFAPAAQATTFQFRNGTVVQGMAGARALIDLSGSSLDLSAVLDNTDLKMDNGSLTATASGAILLGAGTRLTTSGVFSAHSASGLTNAGVIASTGSASYNALANTGTIAVSNGNVTANTLANAGRISLNAATLTVGTPTLLGGVIAFMDPTAKLVFQGAGAVGANLQNFQNGDSVDVRGLSYNASLAVSLQGDAVQVSQGSVLVGSFHLSGGAYTADQFSLAADGAGGTLLRTTHRLSAPVFTGPGRDFDPAYYLAQNPDVAAAGVDPLQHYLSYGWHEGHNPNAYFNTNYYLNQNPDVAATGINPLQHFEDYGWREGRDPGPGFSVSAYLAANPDVRAAGIDPLQHFLANGRAEGRSAFAATPHAAGPQDPLVDRAWYLAQHPDVAASGEDASANYHRVGWTLGYNPDPLFDTTYYLKANPDVAAARIDPLAHFEASGSQEGREPSLAFSDSQYLANNPDVAAAKLNPLLHYMNYGRFEGRMNLRERSAGQWHARPAGGPRVLLRAVRDDRAGQRGRRRQL